MRKILSLLLVFAFSVSTAYAESISKTLHKLGVNKSAVSVSIKEVTSGDTLYSLNDKVPRYPASTLKLVTTSAALDFLGNDHKVKTQFYKSTNNDVYLKLSGDPLLSVEDLEKLMASAKSKDIEPKTFYIDDSIFGTVEWGEGWQWDDILNPYMPKFSAYNINGNVISIAIKPTQNGAVADISTKPFYPVSFVNSIITDFSAANDINISKFNSESDVFNEVARQNMLLVSGKISKMITKTVPVLKPHINFSLRLKEAIQSSKFQYFGGFKTTKLPTQNVYLIDEIKRDLSDIASTILKKSDNLAAESLFKYAGAVYSGQTGNIQNSISMLNAYLANLNIPSDDIKIVDASGVSKNNLMTSEFMTEFLLHKAAQDDFEIFKSYLPTSGEGTLKDRMLYFKDVLYAKTGTLSDNSAIAGYITTRRGNVYAFDIMITDAKTSSADKKNIEEQILRNVYLNY